MKINRMLAAFAVALVAFIGHAATAQTGSEKPETAEIRIGLIGIADNTPAYIADKLGYFEKEGLTVKFNQFPGGGTAQQSLIAGRIDFLHTNAVSILLARAQGFDLTIVSNNSVARAAPPDAGRILVKGNSSIKDLKDLEGKRIAVNLLNNTIWLATRTLLEKRGVDPKKVTFQEVPFPQMIDALLNDRVDAIAIVEPFGTIAGGTGQTKVLGHYYAEVEPNWELAGMVAMESWIRKNPITTQKFVRAFRRGVEFMNANPVEGKKFLVEYTKLDPALADRILLNVFTTKSNPASLQVWEDLMVKNGLLKEKVGIKNIIHSTALE